MVEIIEYRAALHPVMFTLIGMIFIGCFFYWLRERVRSVYAVIEIIFGVVALYRSAPVIEGGGFSQAFDQFAFGGIPNVQLITMIGAVYLIVRGLDNWDKAMLNSPCWNGFRTKFRIGRR